MTAVTTPLSERDVFDQVNYYYKEVQLSDSSYLRRLDLVGFREWIRESSLSGILTAEQRGWCSARLKDLRGYVKRGSWR